jgi:hypothetical protein
MPDSSMESSPTRTRPFGIKAIMVLQLLYVALLITNQVNILTQGDRSDTLPQVPTESVAVAVAILNVLILLGLISVPGLWRLKYWAWVLLMLQIGVSLGVALWAYFSGSPQYGTMVICVAMVFYLNQGDVRRAFSHRRPAGETT